MESTQEARAKRLASELAEKLRDAAGRLRLFVNSEYQEGGGALAPPCGTPPKVSGARLKAYKARKSCCIERAFDANREGYVGNQPPTVASSFSTSSGTSPSRPAYDC